MSCPDRSVSCDTAPRVRWLAWVAALAACSFDPGGSLNSGAGDGGGFAPDAGDAPLVDARPIELPDAAPAKPDATPLPADGDACTDAGDCAASSVCSDNPFESPGGYCVTVGCTVGDDSTCAPGGDGVCVDSDPFDGNPAICVDRCGSPGECRESEGYTCVSIGVGVSGCLSDHAGAGSGCGNDSQCGRSPWECVTDDGFPGGYCGATDCSTDPDSCPAGMFCALVAGDTYCIEPCNSFIGDVDCRFLEGYECADFGSGFFGCIDLDELD
jgi:hypothetical protein